MITPPRPTTSRLPISVSPLAAPSRFGHVATGFVLEGDVVFIPAACGWVNARRGDVGRRVSDFAGVARPRIVTHAMLRMLFIGVVVGAILGLMVLR